MPTNISGRRKNHNPRFMNHDASSFDIASIYKTEVIKEEEISPFSYRSIGAKEITSIFVIYGPGDKKYQNKVNNMRNALRYGLGKDLIESDFGAITLKSVLKKNSKYGCYGDGASDLTEPGLVEAFSEFSESCDDKGTVCIIIYGFGIYDRPNTMFQTVANGGRMSFWALFNILSFVRRTPMAIFVATNDGGCAANHIYRLPRLSVLFGLSLNTGITEGTEVDNWMTSLLEKCWPDKACAMDLMMTYLLRSDVESRHKPVMVSGHYAWNLADCVFKNGKEVTVSAMRNILRPGRIELLAEYYKFSKQRLQMIAKYIATSEDPELSLKAKRLGKIYGNVLALSICHEIIRLLEIELRTTIM